MLAHNKQLKFKPKQGNASKEVMMRYDLFNDIFKAIWLLSVESCYLVCVKLGRIWEKTVVKISNLVGQYSYEQDKDILEESQEPVTESTEFELYFPTKICN